MVKAAPADFEFEASLSIDKTAFNVYPHGHSLGANKDEDGFTVSCAIKNMTRMVI